jgi:hypothetical protein
MNSEFIVNLWAIYDCSTGCIYGLAGRTYFASGSDAEKLSLLRSLSATDYVTAKRYGLPDRFQISFADGTIKKGVTPTFTVFDSNSQLFEVIFKNIESDLPPIPDFSGEDFRAIAQKLPEAPLCCTTILYEDEMGKIRPLLSEEDHSWAAEQEAIYGRGKSITHF